MAATVAELDALITPRHGNHRKDRRVLLPLRKHWFTIPNIKCRGQYEIDLLAVDTTNPRKLRRYHVECGVSISGSYSKLTTKAFSPDRLKIRVQAAGQRRTFGYFVDRKFGLIRGSGGTRTLRLHTGQLSTHHRDVGRDQGGEGIGEKA